jgi:hypothetical protein
VLLLLLLAAVTTTQLATRISQAPGSDHYQFWGVARARRLAGPTLGSPYRDGVRYFETLAAYTAASDDPKLKLAKQYWDQPDFAGTPLLYTIFALAPNEFTRGVVISQVLQVLVFLGAFLRLARLYRLGPLDALGLALCCILFYNPLLANLHVANLGGFQFAALTGVLLLARLLGRSASFLARAGLGALLLSALAALTLCKPNILLIGVLLAAHLGVRHGLRAFAAAALPAAAVALLLVVVPCLYFGSWNVWREWYELVYGGNASMLVRKVITGNFSTPVLLAQGLGVSVYAVSPALLGLVAISLVVVAVRPIVADATLTSSPGRSALAVARRLVEDPSTALCLGLVLTMASSPLFWLHYYVLVLIPGLWLVSGAAGAGVRSWLGVLAVALSSGLFEFVFRPLPWRDAVPASIALSWVPVWIAALLQLGARPGGPAGANA